MNSSNSAEQSTSQGYLLIGDGGAPYVTDTTRDPFAALDDLMTVIEALCPTWPLREPTKDGDYWLL